MKRKVERIPRTFPVRPIRSLAKAKRPMTCDHCRLTWDDAKATGSTPVPSGRCPFEYFHIYNG